MVQPRKKKAGEKENELATAAAVAEVSAASVGGYLRNVAHRHRVPRAEGGKGTRRKVAMVTSSTAPMVATSSIQGTAEATSPTVVEEKSKIEAKIEEVSMDGCLPRETNTGALLRQEAISSLPLSSTSTQVPDTITSTITATTGEGEDTDEDEEDEWDEVQLGVVLPSPESRRQDTVKVERSTNPSSATMGNVASASTTMFSSLKRDAPEEDDIKGGVRKERRVETSVSADEWLAKGMSDVLKREGVGIRAGLSVEGSSVHAPIKVEDGANEASAPPLPFNAPAPPLGEEMKSDFGQTTSLGLGGVVQVSDAAETNEEDDFFSGDVRFARAAPVSAEEGGIASSSAWSRRDPAYEEMRERRDQLAARRRSERMQKVFLCVTEIMALCSRGLWLWREARHPTLLRRLLQLRSYHRVCRSFSEGEDFLTTATANSSSSSLPLLAAVQEARSLVERSVSSGSTKASLAPAWVNLDQDGVKDNSSAAVQILIRAIHSAFSLCPEMAATGPWEGNDSSEMPDDSARPVGTVPQEPPFNRWSTRLEHQRLYKLLTTTSSPSSGEKLALPHPLYFSLILLSLAALCGLDARLVIAKTAPEKKEPPNSVTLESTTSTGTTPQAVTLPPSESAKSPLLTIYGHKKRSRVISHAMLQKGNTTATERESEPAGVVAGSTSVKGVKKARPSSCFWVEVWSPERQMYFSVNPCKGVTTVWGAPYAFAFGKGRVVDVTARYTSSLSRSYQYQHRLGKCIHYRFLWRDSIAWDDTREISDVLVESCSRGVVVSTKTQLERERWQLESLHYSEKVPTTLSQLHRHPLFVIEADLGRSEGIYPKDKYHIVGSVKGHTVYKRSAVQALRSRDGWIREGRSIIRDDERPYKVVPPPASRPFASPASFFGFWQTKPFLPVPLLEDGSLPQHGNTRWYVLLHFEPPAGIAHIREPNIVRVARRMQLDFRFAVIGFEHKKAQENRRGTWVPQMDGIVVRERDKQSLLKAYHQWVKNMEEQAAAKRRDRAFHWWMLLSQRLLAADRLQAMYCQGNAQNSFPLQ